MKMKISKAALSLALFSVLALAYIAAENTEQPISSTKNLIEQNYPAIKSTVSLDTNKETSESFNVNDSKTFAAADNAVIDDNIMDNQNYSTTSQIVKAPVEVLSVKEPIKPEVVGSELLAREARGIRKMSKAMLRKWRLEGILPR